MQFIPRSVREFELYIQLYGRTEPEERLEALQALARRQRREAEQRITSSQALIGSPRTARRRLASPSRRSTPLREARLLLALERLLASQVGNLSVACAQARQLVLEVLESDNVDVFLYDPAAAALVAEGSPLTPMGRMQVALGLDRLSLADAGLVGRVFQTGQSAWADRLDQEPDAHPTVLDELGVCSRLAVPLEVADGRRGVLVASSARPHAFNPEDVHFLEAVAHWLKLTSACLTQAASLDDEGDDVSDEDVGLTFRQQQIAALIRRGLSNREIGEHLVLGTGTVANHVANILSRLGLRSRAQIAAWAAERDLDEAHLYL